MPVTHNCNLQSCRRVRKVKEGGRVHLAFQEHLDYEGLVDQWVFQDQ